MGNGSLPTVLIIDDEPRVQTALRRLLPNGEYELHAANSAEAALKLLETEEYDVVVSDICMPGLSGVELLRHIRNNDDDLPVILVTGQPDLVTATEAVTLRAFRYLTKPPGKAEFCDAVKRAASLRRLARLSRDQASDDAQRERTFDEALGALRIAHQVIVDRDGNPVGREALMRGQTEPLRNPMAILDEAEHFGRMSELGLRIQELAARHFPQGDELLFLNVHPSELSTRTCGTNEALRGLAKRIVLEITERASLESVADLRQRIEELRELGFRVAVDDLGSGYSALNSVVELDPEFVKLDRQLVSGVDTSPRLQSVVEATVRMCRNIGIKVIAECVETEAEVEVLRKLGCDWFQGYYFGRPELV